LFNWVFISFSRPRKRKRGTIDDEKRPYARSAPLLCLVDFFCFDGVFVWGGLGFLRERGIASVTVVVAVLCWCKDRYPLFSSALYIDLIFSLYLAWLRLRDVEKLVEGVTSLYQNV
jgi:hypothetical protein